MKQFEYVKALLKERKVRLTLQRELVLKCALKHLHFTAEQLVADVQSVNTSISRASVYRTLSLLLDVDVIEKHDFRYGAPNYEVTFGKAHHDHLMCVKCGEIIEFQEPRVEQLQDSVVMRYGYKLLSHTHKLYGLCPKCQKINVKSSKKPLRLHVEEIVK